MSQYNSTTIYALQLDHICSTLSNLTAMEIFNYAAVYVYESVLLGSFNNNLKKKLQYQDIDLNDTKQKINTIMQLC